MRGVRPDVFPVPNVRRPETVGSIVLGKKKAQNAVDVGFEGGGTVIGICAGGRRREGRVRDLDGNRHGLVSQHDGGGDDRSVIVAAHKSIAFGDRTVFGLLGELGADGQGVGQTEPRRPDVHQDVGNAFAVGGVGDADGKGDDRFVDRPLVTGLVDDHLV